MAVHKAIRSNPPAQPKRPSLNHQLKAEIFEALRHLNRGYGVALSSFDRLEVKDSLNTPRVFPAGFIASYRNRTESLRALANQDVLLLLAGREEHEAERFGRLCGRPAEPKHKRRS